MVLSAEAEATSKLAAERLEACPPLRDALQQATAKSHEAVQLLAEKREQWAAESNRWWWPRKVSSSKR